MSAQFQFHAGELAVQLRAGEGAIAELNSSVVASSVIFGARAFIAKQFMVVLSTSDAQGKVWASMLFGQPGFLQAGSGTDIVIAVAQDERDAGDPLWRGLGAGAAVGLLFIELGSRRRYRVNGRVEAFDEAGIKVSIDEAFPNCPQYIQRRHLRDLGPQPVRSPAVHGTGFDAEVRALIGAADTVFVASAHAERGFDASHRGGSAGFVGMLDERTLRIPDYRGNSMFNTLGNLALDARVGLLIPDFAAGRLLQVTGTATLNWDVKDLAGTGGTGRCWDVRADAWIVRDMTHRTEWELLYNSPFNHPLMLAEEAA